MKGLGTMKLKNISRKALYQALRKNGTDEHTAEWMIAQLPKNKKARFATDGKFLAIVCGDELGMTKCATYDRRKKTIIVKELCKICKDRVEKVRCSMKDKFDVNKGTSIALNRLIKGE